MSRLESSLETYFYKTLTKAGCLPVKVIPLAAGVPDRMVLVPGGRIFLVELKTEKGGVRQVQRLWHARAQRLGTTVVIVRGKAGIDAWVATLGLTAS